MKRSGIKHGTTPLRRHKPLEGGQPPERRTRIRQQSAKRQKANRERSVMASERFPGRDAWCVVPWCGQRADDLHEPLTRARGGSITDPDNTVPVCRSCHQEITDKQPAWAYEHGLLRHSWEA